MDLSALSDAELVVAHVSAARRLRLMRRVFPLVILVVLVGYIWSIVNQVQALDTDKFADELERKAEALMPRVEEHLVDVAKNLEPVLLAELNNKAAALGPRLEKRLEQDIEALKTKAEKDFEAALVAALAEIEERQRHILEREIPELKGDKKAQDRVLEAVRVGLVRWSVRQLTTTLNEHVVAMEHIRKTLQASYVAAPGEQVDGEKTLMIWLDLMNETVGGDDHILGVNPEDAERAKKAKKQASSKGNK